MNANQGPSSFGYKHLIILTKVGGIDPFIALASGAIGHHQSSFERSSVSPKRGGLFVAYVTNAHTPSKTNFRLAANHV